MTVASSDPCTTPRFRYRMYAAVLVAKPLATAPLDTHLLDTHLLDSALIWVRAEREARLRGGQ